MRTFINPQVGKVGFDFGWFNGEELSVFNFTLWNDCRDSIDMIIIFKLQICKFIIGINLDFNE